MCKHRRFWLGTVFCLHATNKPPQKHVDTRASSWLQAHPAVVAISQQAVSRLRLVAVTPITQHDSSIPY